MCVTFLGFCVRGGMCVRVHVFDWEEGLSSALCCVPLKNNSRIYLGSEFKMSRNIKDQENLRHSYKKVCIFKRLNLFEKTLKTLFKYNKISNAVLYFYYYSKNTKLQSNLCLSEGFCSYNF